MHIKTVAAILAWIAVALLLLNGLIKSQWVVIVAIILAAFAILLYFAPRFMKNKQTQINEMEPTHTK